MGTRKHVKSDLKSVLQAATSLHGHFGPFLTLGVRTGLVGLQELKVKQGDARLSTIVMLEYVVPISCILDGIQTSTGCTVGNTRLTWKESREIGAIFELGSAQRRIEVWVNPAVVQELKRKLAEQPPDEEIRQIGWDIAFRTDAELFLSKRWVNVLNLQCVM